MIASQDQLRKKLINVFRERLPIELQAMEDEENLQRGTLSTERNVAGGLGLFPKYMAHHEMKELELNKLPALLCLSDGVSASRRVENRTSNQFDGDSEPDGDIYRRVYPLRIFAWVTGQDFDDTSLQRDRFEDVVWRSLWRNLKIDENAAIEVDSYSCLYSDVDEIKGSKAMLSGFQSRLSVVVYRNLATSIDGQADTIDTNVAHLGWSTA